MAIPNLAEHRTVHVTLGDRQADIDEKIAPFVKEMWRADIVTSQSCQDSPPGWIWLEFVSQFHVETFLNIVGDYENTVGSLHDRMLHNYDRLARPRVGQWRFEAIVHDMGVDIVEDGAGEREEYAGCPDFAVFISMHFPQDDLPQLLARLRRFNRRRARLAKAAGHQQPHDQDSVRHVEPCVPTAVTAPIDGDVAPPK